MDDLKAELGQIEGDKVETNCKVRLRAFQRKLENRVLEDLQGDQAALGFDKATSPIQVSIGQLYGIEINDFAVAVAKTPFGSPRSR